MAVGVQPHPLRRAASRFFRLGGGTVVGAIAGVLISAVLLAVLGWP